MGALWEAWGWMSGRGTWGASRTKASVLKRSHDIGVIVRTYYFV